MVISTIFKARETVAKENNDSELIELPTQSFVILKAVLYVDQFRICLFRCKEGDCFFFFNGSCHSTQEDERQGPLDVVLYNKQDKHLTDTKSL